ncbi:Carboxylesterase NlhH [termite gut metagenome]|uniref:Carboxylesterase NlhH n=1 Tax=termite gut metagenome TaxID=433724 RepID=A0A5J4RFW5_9ZZZZ
MGLGDSITEGGDSFSCYLYPLWEKLFTAGYAFDFIGPRESACRIGSLNHCGFSGQTVEFLESKIDSLYRLYPADIVLLHAGHNHFAEEKPVPKMIASYKSIIHKIQIINPQVYILMAQVIPSKKLPKYAYIPELNEQIEKMVNELGSDRVRLVNQAEGFDWERHTVIDKVHPNKAGAERMATVWMSALVQILLPSEITYRPEIVSYKRLSNGESLHLHIFKPENLSGQESRPTIVYFFGGGWTHGTPIQFYRECAYYASKGMVAVAADYQIASLHHTTPFESFDDAKDVIRWLRSHASEYRIDPERIAASGASAGGQLAAALGTIEEETGFINYKSNLLVLYYPVVDNGPEGYGTEDMKKQYHKISPLHTISKRTPPVFFAVGTEDPIVSVKTAELFKQKMTDNEVDCELHLFEGAGHPIFYYRKALDETFYKVRQLTDAFLIKHGYIR